MTDASHDWYQKATIAFEKLSPKPGDFVTITVPRGTDPRQMEMVSIYVQEAIQDHLPEGVHAMIVEGGITIENWPKEMMARHGWYKLGGK